MSKAAQQLKGKPNPLAAVLSDTQTPAEKPSSQPPITLPATKPDKAHANKQAPAQAEVRDRPSGGKVAKPSRLNTRMIGGHFSSDWHRQLAIIAAEDDVTKQSLLAEALNDLFVKKGKKKLTVRD